jgi:hypothetical protein
MQLVVRKLAVELLMKFTFDYKQAAAFHQGFEK